MQETKINNIMKNYNFIVSQQEYNFILDLWRTLLLNYYAQEIDVQECKTQHPLNKSNADVKTKVNILNAYYSTRVEVKPMVKNIVNQDVDNDLKKGNLSVVAKIAYATPTRDNFSFATKYCALHEPDLFPIYDSLVWNFFSKLNRLGFFSKETKKKFANVNKNGSKAYNDYIDIYNEFINKSGIRPFFKNYREVDAYIWGAFQMYLLIEKKSKYTGIKPYEQFFRTFAATVLANLTSTAIWHILTQIF